MIAGAFLPVVPVVDAVRGQLRDEREVGERAWSVLSCPEVFIPDLTCGRWPGACDQRGTVDGREWVCTRRSPHSGRHAAGVAGRVVAVW